MKKNFKTHLQLDTDIEDTSYRKNVTSKFIQLCSFIILIVVTLGNFIYSNTNLFYMDLSLLIGLLIVFYLSNRIQKDPSHFILHTMALGMLLGVYFNQGAESTPIWSFLYIFLVMSLYGHKIGLRICIVYFTLLLTLLFSFTNNTVSMMEFIRIMIASCLTLFFAYLAEMVIADVFNKLISTKIQLEALTRTDALTGLYNRRYFDEVLPQQISDINRGHELLALVIIDIDHFKSYNDTFGHPAGDVALVALANLLKAQLKRANDTVFRLGGEEFALLYQAKNEQAALKVIEDIRLAVESLDQYCALEQKVTISAGLLLINEKQNIAVQSAYKLADKLLYQAKNSGRNKIVMSVCDTDNEENPAYSVTS